MKNKLIILVGLCTFCLWTGKSQALNFTTLPIINETRDLPTGYEILELRGDLATNAGPNAIEAGVSDEDVYIQFNQSFGNVSISLYDALSNLIYHSNVNTGVQPIVIIPINSTVEGTFILELNSINGGAEGDFEHTND